MMTVVTLKCWGFVCKKHGTLSPLYYSGLPFSKSSNFTAFSTVYSIHTRTQMKNDSQRDHNSECKTETFHNYSSVIIQVSRCILSASFPESHDPGWRKFPHGCNLESISWIMQQMPQNCWKTISSFRLFKNQHYFPCYLFPCWEKVAENFISQT